MRLVLLFLFLKVNDSSMGITKDFLLLVSASLLLVGCENRNSNNNVEKEANQPVQTKVQNETGWPESGSTEGDTINIHGKVLLFYGPVKENATDDDKEFLLMMDRILGVLESRTDIRKIYTSASFIRIYNPATGKPMTVDRTKHGKRNGFLVTDGGQPPKMSNESLSEEDCLMIIKSYFFLPS
jgi:hypothetical protein